MKKKQRQMIGMLLALVVLAAAFLGIRQYNKNASSATSITEDTQETVLDVNSDDITSFRYVYEGETYAFEKEDETWYYADDHSLNLNQDRIKAMILKVAEAVCLRKAFSVSGLDAPEEIDTEVRQ